MADLIGTLWVERDNRFVRVVEVVAYAGGDPFRRIGRRTVSFNGKAGHPTRVTYGDASKFFKRFRPHPTTPQSNGE